MNGKADIVGRAQIYVGIAKVEVSVDIVRARARSEGSGHGGRTQDALMRTARLPPLTTMYFRQPKLLKLALYSLDVLGLEQR